MYMYVQSNDSEWKETESRHSHSHYVDEYKRTVWSEGKGVRMKTPKMFHKCVIYEKDAEHLDVWEGR